MRKKICIALITAFTVLLGVSGYFIFNHYREAEQQAQMYDSLAQIVEDSKTEPAELIPYSEDKTILPELTELYQQNNDLVGWICVEDTNINYPVMQTVDNPNYYLKRGFDKEYSSYGCPYVQEDCDVLKPSDNLVIYGHHMNNGSMFADLEKFKDKDFWQEHKRSALKRGACLNALPRSRSRSPPASIRWRIICPLRRWRTALSTPKTIGLSRWSRSSPSISCCGAQESRGISSTPSFRT